MKILTTTQGQLVGHEPGHSSDGSTINFSSLCETLVFQSIFITKHLHYKYIAPWASQRCVVSLFHIKDHIIEDQTHILWFIDSTSKFIILYSCYQTFFHHWLSLESSQEITRWRLYPYSNISCLSHISKHRKIFDEVPK